MSIDYTQLCGAGKALTDLEQDPRRQCCSTECRFQAAATGYLAVEILKRIHAHQEHCPYCGQAGAA
jgi:hypothetical protein